MSNIGSWFRNLGNRMASGLRHFMRGRYGTDKLNTAILLTGVAACLLSVILRLPLVNWLLTVLSYVLMGWAIFRMLSRNTYKRYQENRKYLRFIERLKDRQHKYFDCPAVTSRFVFPEERVRSLLPAPSAR